MSLSLRPPSVEWFGEASNEPVLIIAAAVPQRAAGSVLSRRGSGNPARVGAAGPQTPLTAAASLPRRSVSAEGLPLLRCARWKDDSPKA